MISTKNINVFSFISTKTLIIFSLIFNISALPSFADQNDLGQSRSISLTRKDIQTIEGKKLALVIGNSAYSTSRLKNPVNDATAIAASLRNLDFDVTLRVNGTRRDMVRDINDFGKRLRYADVGLFYYAGHGMQLGGRNYILPIDATMTTESDLEFEAVDTGRLIGKMEDASSKLNIIILDACRDNPFASNFRSASSKGLAISQAPRGTLLAFATSPGSVAADGNSNNGIYTKHLLANMNKKGLTLEEVFKQVRIGVVDETNGKQVPWETSSLMGAFYFSPGDSTNNGGGFTPAQPLSASIMATRNTTRVSAERNQQQHNVSPAEQELINMLNSNQAKQQKLAARKIIKQRLYNSPVIMQTVRDELIKGYLIRSRDKHHIDSMAWLCKVLGASKNHDYANTLYTVYQDRSTPRKLKKYAKKSYRSLR